METRGHSSGLLPGDSPTSWWILLALDTDWCRGSWASPLYLQNRLVYLRSAYTMSLFDPASSTIA